MNLMVNDATGAPTVLCSLPTASVFVNAPCAGDAAFAALLRASRTYIVVVAAVPSGAWCNAFASLCDNVSAQAL